MFREAIVGIDGHDGGRDALAFARSLGAERLSLVAAYPVDRVPTRAALRRRQPLLSREATRQLTAAGVEAGDVTVHAYAVGDPSPARALQRAALEHGADLIVVGSSHWGLTGRLLPGAVSGGVLHDAPCPVAVAPRGARECASAPSTAVVGFDGSAEALEALVLAVRLRDELETRLVVFEAVIPPVGWRQPSPQVVDWQRIAAEQRQEADKGLRGALARVGGKAQLIVDHGEPGSSLVRICGDTRAGLLVVGSRGWGAPGRVALGSTAEYVINHAHCPVVIVPRPTAEDATSNGGRRFAVGASALEGDTVAAGGSRSP